MKQLMTIALALIAIALGSVQALAAVTAIKRITNQTAANVYVRSYEMSYGFVIPPDGRPYSVDMWIPWATSQRDFNAGHHISIEQPTGYCKWTIWQANWSTDGDRIRVSRCVFQIPGDRIQGYSDVGGDRQMIIDRYGTPYIYVLGFKRHGKIRRAPIARR